MQRVAGCRREPSPPHAIWGVPFLLRLMDVVVTRFKRAAPMPPSKEDGYREFLHTLFPRENPVAYQERAAAHNKRAEGFYSVRREGGWTVLKAFLSALPLSTDRLKRQFMCFRRQVDRGLEKRQLMRDRRALLNEEAERLGITKLVAKFDSYTDEFRANSLFVYCETKEMEE